MENELLTIPYVVYEQEKAHQHKLNVKLFAIIIILIIALLGTNIGWIIYESQFEVVGETQTSEQYEYEVTQDSNSGHNNFIGHDGNIINGETDDKS